MASEHSSLKAIFSSISAPQISGFYAEEELERIQEPEMRADSKEAVFFRQKSTDTHIN